MAAASRLLNRYWGMGGRPGRLLSADPGHKELYRCVIGPTRQSGYCGRFVSPGIVTVGLNGSVVPIRYFWLITAPFRCVHYGSHCTYRLDPRGTSLEQWLRWMHLWILQKTFQVPSGLLLKPNPRINTTAPNFTSYAPQFWNYETEFCNRSAPSTVAAHTNNEMVLRDKSSNYSPEGRVAKLPEPI